MGWASRPYGRNSFNGKSVAVISATPGAIGGVAAQDQLKQVLLAVTLIVVTPAVIVASAHQKFDQQGNLTDEDTKQFLAGLLSNLTNQARLLTCRLKPSTVKSVITS